MAKKTLQKLVSKIIVLNKQLLFHGVWFALAKIGYILLFTIVFHSQIVGAYEFHNALKHFTSTPLSEIRIKKTDNGLFIVTNEVDNYSKNYLSGVEKGDVILSVNGKLLTPNITEDKAQSLIEGIIGETTTLTVQKSNGEIKELNIIHLEALIKILNRFLFSITPSVLFTIVFWTLTTLLLSSTILSFLIFRVPQASWSAILVATSTLLLPYMLNEFIALLGMFGPLEIGKLATPAFLGYKFGSVFLLLSLYTFPDGRLYPAWTKWMFVALLIFTPRTLNRYDNTLIFSLVAWIGLLIGALFIQTFKYKKISKPIEKQQIKWVMVGVFFIVFVLSTSEILDVTKPDWWSGGNSDSIWESVFISLRSFVIASSILVLSSLVFVVSIYKVGLWDADIYINRAIVYSLITAILAIIWTVSIALLQFLIEQFTTQQPPFLAAILSSIQVAALFNPVRGNVEKWVNEKFYKDRIKFTEAIIELQAEKWQFISSRDLLQLLASKVAQLIKSANSAIYLRNDNECKLFLTYDNNKIDIITPKNEFSVDAKSLEQLKSGKITKLPEDSPYVLLIPLTVRRSHINDLVGILALGRRKDGRGYSRDHLSDLSELGKNAGVALHFLQLRENKNAL